MVLKAHRPFESCEKAVREHIDIKSEATEVEHYDQRRKVEETDIGERIKRSIHELEELLQSYMDGTILERPNKNK